MYLVLTLIPYIVTLNFSAINRSYGSTERSPIYTRFFNDNLKFERNRTKPKINN